jgi:hypothetical protein
LVKAGTSGKSYDAYFCFYNEVRRQYKVVLIKLYDPFLCVISAA